MAERLPPDCIRVRCKVFLHLTLLLDVSPANTGKKKKMGESRVIICSARRGLMSLDLVTQFYSIFVNKQTSCIEVLLEEGM